MLRINLITQEKAKEASEGKLKNEIRWIYEEVSINDNLEMFFTHILRVSIHFWLIYDYSDQTSYLA